MNAEVPSRTLSTGDVRLCRRSFIASSLQRHWTQASSLPPTPPPWHPAPARAAGELDSHRWRFLWMEGTCITGGKCKVAWKRALRPTKLGGLGILDTQCFSRALRIRWLWLAWTSDNKPWSGMEEPCTKSDCRLFNAATKITIGNGAKASFWHSA